MKYWIYQVARIGVSIIFLQTLFFKFTGSPESVFIFSSIGLEPWGRIGAGIVELLAVALIFFPRTVWIGAGIAFGTMAGAILSHLTMLGIVVQDDGGLLFALALVSALLALLLLYFEKDKIIEVLFKTKNSIFP